MKKSVLKLSVIFSVLLGLFNLLCFWLQPERTESFYISIGFGNGSIIIFLLSCLLLSLKKKKYVYVQNPFIISTYYILSVTINLIFALTGMSNIKVNVLTNVILLSLYIIILLILSIANQQAIQQKTADKEKRDRVYNMLGEIEILLGRGKDLNTNKKLEMVYDKIKSCQYNTSVDVSSFDEDIIKIIKQIESFLNTADMNMANQKCIEAIRILEARDRYILDKLRRE